MLIRIAKPAEYPKVLELYEACNYKGGLQENDVVIIAEESELIGAVRICAEQGVSVLRGMQIKNVARGKGTGTLMLKFLQENLDMTGCYCIPYKHLKVFYGQIGFEEIQPHEAPGFLAERLKKYLNGGLDVMIMKIKS